MKTYTLHVQVYVKQCCLRVISHEWDWELYNSQLSSPSWSSLMQFKLSSICFSKYSNLSFSIDVCLFFYVFAQSMLSWWYQCKYIMYIQSRWSCEQRMLINRYICLKKNYHGRDLPRIWVRKGRNSKNSSTGDDTKEAFYMLYGFAIGTLGFSSGTEGCSTPASFKGRALHGLKVAISYVC